MWNDPNSELRADDERREGDGCTHDREVQSAEELLPVVYNELRRLAAHKVHSEGAGLTLQATALVHEAWLRLSGDGHRKFRGQAHFFAAAAEAMRRILIDAARRKARLKRGGNAQREEFDEHYFIDNRQPEDLLTINEAIDRLSVIDPASADVVKLRFFVGMTMEEASVALGIPLRTTWRHWAYARAWLRRELKRDGPS